MTPQTTLDAVRELSENAMLRPASRHLRFTRPQDPRPGPRPAIVAYEDSFLPRIGGTNRPHQAGRRRVRPVEHVTLTAMEKDWLALAVDKAQPEAA